MLNKLLKYDLKWTLKILAVFYVLTLFFAIITRIVFEIDNNSLMLLITGKILQGFTISMIVSALINTFMRMWLRFKNNIYGDESYLTHTLPVDKKSIYLSKVLTALITMFTTIFVIFLAVIIMYYSNDNLILIKSSLEGLSNIYNSNIAILLLIAFFLIFLEMFLLLMIGFIGLIIGHKANNGKVLKSIIYGFILYTATQLLTLLIIFIVGLFSKDIMDLFMSSNINSFDSIKMVMIISMIIYSIYNIVYYFIGKKTLQDGVNVE